MNFDAEKCQHASPEIVEVDIKKILRIMAMAITSIPSFVYLFRFLSSIIVRSRTLGCRDVYDVPKRGSVVGFFYLKSLITASAKS